MFDSCTIYLRPSPSLTVVFGLLVAATLSSLMLIALPLALMISGSIIVLFTGIFTLGQYAWLIWPMSIHSINISIDNTGQLQVFVSNKAGEKTEAFVQTDTLITPIISVLVFKRSAKSLWTHKVLITFDNCDREQFRRFRVIARIS